MFRNLIILSVLGFSSSLASASIIYEFDTILMKVSGSDSDGLDGARINFTAVLPENSIYRNRWGQPYVYALSNEWTILDSNIDGIYSSVGPVDWTGSYNGNRNAGWFSAGSHINGIADLSLVAIFHYAVPGVTIGDPVKIADFGPLILNTRNFFRASDSSQYNWQNNASFKVYDSNTIPEPATIPLILIGLFGAMLINKLKHQA